MLHEALYLLQFSDEFLMNKAVYPDIKSFCKEKKHFNGDQWSTDHDLHHWRNDACYAMQLESLSSLFFLTVIKSSTPQVYSLISADQAEFVCIQ